MNEIIYKKGKIEELHDIFEVFTEAVETMNRLNIMQWDEVYPNIDILREDIMKEQLYVGRILNDIAAVFVLSNDFDEQYNNGRWKCTDAHFMVVHRLCVRPKFQNCGIGTNMLHYIDEELSRNGIESIRLDVFSQNPYSLKMYARAGYEKVGEAHWRKGLFYLMEKRILEK